MTREEALNKAINIVAYFEAHFAKSKEAREDMVNIIEALEQEPKTDYKAFAEWVSTEIFSKDWEYNKDSFAEIACRKLNKLGVVDTDGTMWIYENEASEQEPENEDVITHIEAVQDNLNRMVDGLDDDTDYYDATYHLEQIKEKVEQEPKTDILDRIRAEIENDWQLKKYPSSPFSCGLRRAIEIIDKYRQEGEK